MSYVSNLNLRKKGRFRGQPLRGRPRLQANRVNKKTGQLIQTIDKHKDIHERFKERLKQLNVAVASGELVLATEIWVY